MSEKKLLTVFMEKMATDEGFALKVAAMQTPEGLMELAKSVGVTLTQEQAELGLKKVKAMTAEGKSLDEDELDGVAGGDCGSCMGYDC